MIDYTETFTLATKAIWRNKARSSLTMLGIIIGVSAVILLISVGQGLQNYITQQFESIGSNQIFVLPGKGLEGFGSGPPNLAGSKLTLRHVESISRLGGSVKTAAADNELPSSVKYKGTSIVSTVAGTSAEWLVMSNVEIGNGRGLTDSDVEQSRNVAIVGKSVVEELFGSANPVGQNITVGDQSFKIIGELNELGTQSIGIDVDNFVIIPITTSQRVFGVEAITTIVVQAVNKDEIPIAVEQVERYLKTQLDEDDFSVVDQESLLNTINQILGVLTAALGGIAAISLVVGGVGIMNIMLVSVTERTREIGLRKAIGAKPSDISSQFVIEAVALSVSGGGIGIIIGWLGSLALNPYFPTHVTLWSIALAFGVSAAIGILFGVAPAVRASKLNPIDALRYE
ncbi:ABC transporter permease [Candidatus Woesebacteria bacterium]|nr:MAG: ABC transporter permease [Candidatus Woesebacteria bacterium]